MLSPPLYPPDGQHSAFHPPLRLVTQHHPRTQPFPYKSPLLCQSHRTRESPSSAAHHSSKGSTALHPPVHPVSHAGLPSTRSMTAVLSATVPTWLWATPCRLALGKTHIAG